MTHGKILFQRDHMPTAAHVLEVIKTMPHEVEPCVYVPCRGHQSGDTFSCDTCNRKWDYGDQPPKPLRCEVGEVWIDLMGVWVQYDGRFIAADLNRGRIYPNWFMAWRLRRAIRKALGR